MKRIIGRKEEHDKEKEYEREGRKRQVGIVRY
jgi:hypothetical protein